jgi:hypothetical protein
MPKLFSYCTGLRRSTQTDFLLAKMLQQAGQTVLVKLVVECAEMVWLTLVLAFAVWKMLC